MDKKKAKRRPHVGTSEVWMVRFHGREVLQKVKVVSSTDRTVELRDYDHGITGNYWLRDDVEFIERLY